MERMVWRSERECDCWMRVFRRSAGWRRMAERRPEERPARKWKALYMLVGHALRFGVVLEVVVGLAYRMMTSCRFGRHLTFRRWIDG